MVKLTGSALSRALRHWPERWRAALVFGPDEGLVRERAETIARQIVPDVQDAFHVTRLDEDRLKSDPAILSDELQALSMFGGRRLVWLRLQADALAATVAAALERPAGDSFLLIESGNLGPRARLRSLFEKGEELAAIPCYADSERDLAALIDGWLREQNLAADPEARAYLLAELGRDRAVSRQELEKLALFFADARDRRLDLATVEALIGESGAADVQDVVRTALAGDPDALERRWTSALAGGVQPIAVLRVLAQQLIRLKPLMQACASGGRPAEVVARARPPIFFRDQPAVRAALARLPLREWGDLLAAVVDAEAAIKHGRPAVPLVGRLLIQVATAGRPPLSSARGDGCSGSRSFPLLP
ncbi:MAG: DNA polymerase III subunit delta [Alphaproteobacteria bacterium]|nr:MAG: DNA polymerase III subunit delta [Alphaproteobacteria bacterium]